MEILIITSNYPSKSLPANGTFVQQFVWALARQGNNVVVIRPTSIFDLRYGELPPYKEKKLVLNKYSVKVYRPRYISFSSQNLVITHSARLTQFVFNNSVYRLTKSLDLKPDIVYGHFLYPAGFSAVKIGRALGIPTVVGVGEDSLWTIKPFGENFTRKHFNRQVYFLANSTLGAKRLMLQLQIPSQKINVEPNGVDLSLFYPRDKISSRERFGLNKEDFIVAFVGSNEYRKGPDRLLSAVEIIDNVKVIFAGVGTEDLNSDRILLKGPLPHAEMPYFLSAADIFVLPTLSEGSCNAVIEAMACGLPIVTSDGPHMDDIVDDKIAIRINALDIKAIAEAILLLKNNLQLREKMALASLKKAKMFDIDKRAHRITEWMKTLEFLD